MTDCSLRPATDADREFLCALYASTRTEELAPVPWSDEQKRAFLRQQFEAQDVHYRQYYPKATFEVIEIGGERAGRIYIDRSFADEFRLMDIALLPSFRGSGVGTRLIRALLDEAAVAKKAVRIHVEQFNPALRLYERLGFRKVQDKGVYFMLEWRAQPKIAS